MQNAPSQRDGAFAFQTGCYATYAVATTSLPATAEAPVRGG